MPMMQMFQNRLANFIRWLHRLPGRPARHPPERQQALDLLAAIDAGGIPLNAARVNHIARQLGLDVSANAPMSETIARIRVCTQHWH